MKQGFLFPPLNCIRADVFTFEPELKRVRNHQFTDEKIWSVFLNKEVFVFVFFQVTDASHTRADLFNNSFFKADLMDIFSFISRAVFLSVDFSSALFSSLFLISWKRVALKKKSRPGGITSALPLNPLNPLNRWPWTPCSFSSCLPALSLHLFPSLRFRLTGRGTPMSRGIAFN